MKQQKFLLDDIHFIGDRTETGKTVIRPFVENIKRNRLKDVTSNFYIDAQNEDKADFAHKYGIAINSYVYSGADALRVMENNKTLSMATVPGVFLGYMNFSTRCANFPAQQFAATEFVSVKNLLRMSRIIERQIEKDRLREEKRIRRNAELQARIDDGRDF